MRNNAFTLTLTTLVAGIFGFFLRWLQNLNGFDDNGLAIPGASIAAVFLVYSLVVLVVFMLEERLYFRKLEPRGKAAQALGAPGFPVRALIWVIAAVMVIGCLVLMFSSDFAPFPTMQRVTSALGIFAGLCLPFILSPKSEEGGSSAVAALVPVLFGCLWLVTAYRVESANPILWSYAPGLLAIIAALVAYYYISAYFYGHAKPGRCLVFLQLAAYLCICTLMDEHSLAESLVFGATAATMLVFQYCLIRNAETYAQPVEETPAEEAQEGSEE